VMYYKHPNGSFHRVSDLNRRRHRCNLTSLPPQVPQFANQYIGNPNGGMTVYYIQPFDGQKVTAPPKVDNHVEPSWI
jgi:hypothetical protein